MRILVKMPSRGRPDKLLALVKELYDTAYDNSQIDYVFTLDSDDATITPEVLQQLKQYGEPVVGTSKSKIDACNRDIAGRTFDIVCLISDDMRPAKQWWDAILRQLMQALYPDTDGVLFFNDGHQKQRVNTISIMGKRYYERFGYMYHPDYKSFYCDDEFTQVADALGKQTYFDDPLFLHLHYLTIGAQEDDTYKVNGRFYEEDKLRFKYRKMVGFPGLGMPV